MFRAAIFVLAGITATAQNWPGFRGPGARGIGDGLNAPATWNAEKGINLAWKTPIGDSAIQAPIVWGDRVFVTTAVSKNPTPGRALTATATRERQRNAGVPAHLPRSEHGQGNVGRRRARVHAAGAAAPKNTHASPTPVTDGKHVIAYFGSEGLFAFDLNGKLLWKRDLGNLDAGAFDVPEYQWGIASSPTLYKNLVIVQCDIQKGSFIAAFDADSGKEVWRTARDARPSWSTPTVYEGKSRAELITNGAEHMRGYDPMTGRELWSLKGTSSSRSPPRSWWMI